MRLIVITAIALAAAGAAQAAPGPAIRATVATFQKVDTDKNRQISGAEWAAADRNAEAFARIDRNGNGQIGPWEMLRAIIARIAAGRN